MRVRLVSLAALVFLVLVSAAWGREVVRSSALAAGAGTAARVPLPALKKRCYNLPDGGAKVFWFRAKDGALLDGAVLGHGRMGVLLAHEHGSDLCGWLPFAVLLSKQGYHVLLFDFRGDGLSPVPRSQSLGRVDIDVESGVRELRRRGATRVVLGGASLGASAVLTAAASIKPAVTSVFSLSPASTKTLGTISSLFTQLNPDVAVTRLKMPVLYVAASHNDYLVIDVRKLHRRTSSVDKRLVFVPGYGYGTAMLADGAEGTRLQNLILAFIRATASG